MSKLKNELARLRDAYRGEQYPFDLANQVLGETGSAASVTPATPRKGKRQVLAAALVAALAASLLLVLMPWHSTEVPDAALGGSETPLPVSFKTSGPKMIGVRKPRRSSQEANLTFLSRRSNATLLSLPPQRQPKTDFSKARQPQRSKPRSTRKSADLALARIKKLPPKRMAAALPQVTSRYRSARNSVSLVRRRMSAPLSLSLRSSNHGV